jgi:hypothetical protein
MKTRLLLSVVLILSLLAVGCREKSSETEQRVSALRSQITSGAGKFDAIASIAHSHSVQMMNATLVRFQNGAETTLRENLNLKFSQGDIQTLGSFFELFPGAAVFISEKRVNFGLWGTGLTVSGTSIGLIIADPENHQCNSLVKRLPIDGRGMHCELLSVNHYLYVQRN